MTPFELITKVFMLCYKHNGSVTSWGRTKKHNKDVGGVQNSYHMLWISCDVVLDTMEKSEEFEKDSASLGLLALLEGDHYHLQPK
jgi:hypothetical protein